MHAWIPSLFLSQRNFCLRINQKILGVVFRVPREIHSTTNKPHLHILPGEIHAEKNPTSILPSTIP